MRCTHDQTRRKAENQLPQKINKSAAIVFAAKFVTLAVLH